MMCVEVAAQDLSPRRRISIPAHRHNGGLAAAQIVVADLEATKPSGGLCEDCLRTDYVCSTCIARPPK